jgi:hypothetical protein
MNQALAFRGNSNTTTYGCTALAGTNKAGILKPDENGYYRMVLGALNVFNSSGQYWPYDDQAKEVFAQSGSLMRRINAGTLRGEYGHPRRLPGMTDNQYISRILDIYEPNVSHHISEITIDYNSVVDKMGRKVLAITGLVKPQGPRGPDLLASINNPKENVCFSIRSLTDDRVMGQVVNKSIRALVTWDYVNEPGLAIATKWNNPSLESLEDTEFQLGAAKLRLVVDNFKKEHSGQESSILLMDDIIKDLGWSRIEIGPLPPSASW